MILVNRATVLSAIDAIRPERVIELATTFCSIPSPAGEESRLAEFIAETLDLPGIEVHIEDVVAGRPNVVARVEGDGDGLPLVLNGHIDASYYPTGWSRDPLRPWAENGRLFGGAITDMKGALAAMVAAIEAAPSAGRLGGDLILHAVMHHDTIGTGAKVLLCTDGPNHGYGICGEPSDLAIHTGNGGAIKWRMRLRGRGGHISRSEGGVDALAAARQVCDALEEFTFDHEPCSRLPDLPRSLVGVLRAGSAPGAVADEAIIEGDVRTVPGMTRRGVLAQLSQVASAACDPRIEIQTRSLAVQHPFLGATEGLLVDAISTTHKSVFGTAPRVTNELPTQAFVTDAADMVAAGIETVVYGVGSWHYAPDEWIDIEELVGSARAYLGTAVLLNGDD